MKKLVSAAVFSAVVLSSNGMASTQKNDSVYREVQQVISETEGRSLSGEDIDFIVTEVNQLLLSRTDWTDGEREQVLESLVNLIHAGQSRDPKATWKAAQELHDLIVSLGSGEQERIFDTIGSIIKLVKAIAAGDVWGIIKELVSLLISLIG